MAILDGFIGKRENFNTKQIGKFECQGSTLSNMVVGMLISCGLSNPTGITGKTSKGVKIKKKGSNYIVSLEMFTPPLVINWTGPMDWNKLNALITSLADTKQQIGFVNILSTPKGKSYQLALTK